MRLRPWFLAAFLVAFCAGVFLLLEWQRRSRDFSDSALLMHFPDDEGSVMYLNVQALRQSGLLDVIAGQRAEEEPEYQDFVRATAFNYRDDLDAVMAHFGVDAELFILRGRFSWDQISRYMKANAAKCINGVCSLPVSRGRYVSAMPLSPDVIAVGTGTHRTVVYSALNLRERRNSNLPTDPFWLELSPEFLKNPKRLPEGTRAFLSAVNGARNVFLSVSPESGRLEARLVASFASAAEAAARRSKLEATTALLRKFFERDKQRPSESEIATMLLSGTFEQHEGEVVGRWPMPATLFRKAVEGN